jgi:hypothetical protein
MNKSHLENFNLVFTAAGAAGAAVPSSASTATSTTTSSLIDTTPLRPACLRKPATTNVRGKPTRFAEKTASWFSSLTHEVDTVLKAMDFPDAVLQQIHAHCEPTVYAVARENSETIALWSPDSNINESYMPFETSFPGAPFTKIRSMKPLDDERFAIYTSHGDIYSVDSNLRMTKLFDFQQNSEIANKLRTYKPHLHYLVRPEHIHIENGFVILYDDCMCVIVFRYDSASDSLSEPVLLTRPAVTQTEIQTSTRLTPKEPPTKITTCTCVCVTSKYVVVMFNPANIGDKYHGAVYSHDMQFLRFFHLASLSINSPIKSVCTRPKFKESDRDAIIVLSSDWRYCKAVLFPMHIGGVDIVEAAGGPIGTSKEKALTSCSSVLSTEKYLFTINTKNMSVILGSAHGEEGSKHPGTTAVLQLIMTPDIERTRIKGWCRLNDKLVAIFGITQNYYATLNIDELSLRSDTPKPFFGLGDPDFFVVLKGRSRLRDGAVSVADDDNTSSCVSLASNAMFASQSKSTRSSSSPI